MKKKKCGQVGEGEQLEVKDLNAKPKQSSFANLNCIGVF
jgi:hypothetical protein